MAENIPELQIDPEVMEGLRLVMVQKHEDLQLLKLHLFTEYLLNRIISNYLCTDQSGLDSIRLSYAQKVGLVNAAGWLNKVPCDFLKTLNALRRKLAHDFNYKLSRDDKDSLWRVFRATLGNQKLPTLDDPDILATVAAGVSGYFGGAIHLSKLAAQRLRPGVESEGEGAE